MDRNSKENRLFGVALTLYNENRGRVVDAATLAAWPLDTLPFKTTRCHRYSYICNFCYHNFHLSPQCLRNACVIPYNQTVYYIIHIKIGLGLCHLGEDCIGLFLKAYHKELARLKDEYEHLFIVLRMQAPVPKELIMLIFQARVRLHCQCLLEAS
jgi:hypothetical protein